MKDKQNQFFSALRGLEKVKTPLQLEAPVRVATTSELPQQINSQEMTPQELAEYWNGEPLSED